MRALFGAPKMPAAQPMPVQPTVDDARQAEEDLARLRRRKGRADTFLAGTFGKPQAPTLGANTSATGASGARAATSSSFLSAAKKIALGGNQ